MPPTRNAFSPLFGLLIVPAAMLIAPPTSGAGEKKAAEEQTSPFLSNVRQLTYAGRRSGEGYFSADGSKMIFQSERVDGNPFFQMYILDLETGRTRRISPGVGKTTCGWIHPSGKKALFASTHEDPHAKKKQKKRLERRKAGKTREYSWDFDKHYEIYEKNLETGELTALTDAVGYDAEGSYSPDGDLILFGSNRSAYQGDLTKKEKKRLEKQPSYFMDLYRMAADGTDVRRLTKAPGYDGGPFFSPSGDRLVWRRFAPDGATAEIYTMGVDGTGVRQLTDLGLMSWAPYYHPSGDYIIFANNKHGFENFELYLVDRKGKHKPVRVTYEDSFDSLPVFTPDGEKLAWTTDRVSGEKSQIAMADWNDALARRRLGLETQKTASTSSSSGEASATAEVDVGAPAIRTDDLMRHIKTLTADRMAGRLTGTRGAKRATRYVASAFDAIGLKPAGKDGGWYSPFEFTAGVSLGPDNRLVRHGKKKTTYETDTAWRPVAFSETGEFGPAPVVFAGYGLVAPKTDAAGRYDSYAHLDVKDKWVLVFRFLPKNIGEEKRRAWSRYSSLRHKARMARERGALGLIAVPGPTAEVKKQLVELSFDATLGEMSLATLSVTNDVAASWLDHAGKDLKKVQQRLDDGEPRRGFSLGVELAATVDIEQERKTGRNVLARLPADGTPSVAVGAHVDHLGRGGAGSLAKDAANKIHPGADDNASGVAAMLEMAHRLASRKAKGKLDLRRDILFAAWSGEELGLLGSSAYTEQLAKRLDGDTLRPAIGAYVNLDMVGRYRPKKGLILHGTGSSPMWSGLIERANVPVGLRLSPKKGAFVPTDATSFYSRGVPILSAFTGVHDAYHTPKDTPEKIHDKGLAKIGRFLTRVVRGLARKKQTPEYVAMKPDEDKQSPGGLRVYLGTIPDYGATDVTGVKLQGVAEGGPAEKAGVQGGDVVVGLAGEKVENIYDYTHAINGLKVGEAVKIVVRREGKKKTLEIVPDSRE